MSENISFLDIEGWLGRRNMDRWYEIEYAFEDMETINNALKSADELLANEPEVGRIDYSDRSEDINVIYETFKGCYTYIYDLTQEIPDVDLDFYTRVAGNREHDGPVERMSLIDLENYSSKIDGEKYTAMDLLDTTPIREDEKEYCFYEDDYVYSEIYQPVEDK